MILSKSNHARGKKYVVDGVCLKNRNPITFRNSESVPVYREFGQTRIPATAVA